MRGASESFEDWSIERSSLLPPTGSKCPRTVCLRTAKHHASLSSRRRNVFSVCLWLTLCWLTNLSNRTPFPLENEPRRNLREKPTCTPNYNTPGGGSIGLRHGESYSETGEDRSISGYAKDRVRAAGAAPTGPMLRASGARVPDSSAVPSKPRRWRDRAAARE